MYPSDYLGTRSNRELVELLRDSRTLPLEHLLNHGAVTVDYAKQRIERDSFWKGSFARDTVLGWDARLFTPAHDAEPYFTGGTFWKRFDEAHGDSLTGYVINYGVSALPGLPKVRLIRYPDDSSPYVRGGDDVLLLEYQNHPYRLVYDLLKIVDPNNCVGIFHLGRFPRGIRAGTFLLARNSYPFDKMSVPDHDAIFDGAEARAPAARELTGTWSGTRVFVRHPEVALANQFNPPVCRLAVSGGDADLARVRFGLREEFARVQVERDHVSLTNTAHGHEELRIVGRDTLLGRGIADGEGGRRDVMRRYVLRRRKRVAED